jgi:hypothetical protein
MAEPLRKDPDLPPQPPKEPFNVHRYGDPNRGSSRWWFWLLLAAVVIWFAIWGWGGHRAHPAKTTPVVVPQKPAAPAGPPMDVASMIAQPSNYIGKHVQLRDVLVQDVNGDASIFVGTSDTQRLLVLLKKGSVPNALNGKPMALPTGGVITINGTAMKPASTGDLEHAAHIKRKVADEVEKQGIVIEADSAIPQTM